MSWPRNDEAILAEEAREEEATLSSLITRAA